MTNQMKQIVHENECYIVRVVHMSDMSFETYGIINKDTGVIEQLQPNLYNARFIADQFNKWLTVGPDEEDDVSAILTQFNSGGKAN